MPIHTYTSQVETTNGQTKGHNGQIPGQNEETRGPAEGFPETMSATKRDPASMLEVCLYKELFFSMTSYFFSNFFS
jgi:hypothetical protein